MAVRNIIEGTVTIAKSKKDYYRLKDKTILVVKNTTPDVVVVMDKIEVIVAEVDNKLCHAAIIAREFDKPLLMGIDNATRMFKTGDRVVIDLDNKTINKTR